tara:strand:- start:1695 stop:2114 length:420 start_codon:yes stop_codon:yes gene_type:complete
MSGLAAQVEAESAGAKTTISDVRSETRELLQALKSYTAEQKDAAMAVTTSTLEKLDQRIDAVESRVDENWNRMDQAARKQARASLKALRQERVQVAEWYGGMRSSSADAWEHMKRGFSNAYQALSDAWEKSEHEFATND